MVRVGDAALTALDQLVEGGLFGSRSEAAAFLLGAGIDAQQKLFERIGKHSAEIRRIRQSLKEDALDALQSISPRRARLRKTQKGER